MSTNKTYTVPVYTRVSDEGSEKHPKIPGYAWVKSESSKSAKLAHDDSNGKKTTFSGVDLVSASTQKYILSRQNKSSGGGADSGIYKKRTPEVKQTVVFMSGSKNIQEPLKSALDVAVTRGTYDKLIQLVESSPTIEIGFEYSGGLNNRRNEDNKKYVKKMLFSRSGTTYTLNQTIVELVPKIVTGSGNKSLQHFQSKTSELRPKRRLSVFDVVQTIVDAQKNSLYGTTRSKVVFAYAVRSSDTKKDVYGGSRSGRQIVSKNASSRRMRSKSRALRKPTKDGTPSILIPELSTKKSQKTRSIKAKRPATRSTTAKPKTAAKKTPKKRTTIKGKTGYELVTKTRKSYCVGPSKQTYWKRNK